MARANVKITANGVGRGRVIVDDTDITRGISGADVKINAGDVTTVSLRVIAPNIEALDLSGAIVAVSGVAMPMSVEMALYKHLLAKHGPLEIDAMPLDSEYTVTTLKSA